MAKFYMPPPVIAKERIIPAPPRANNGTLRPITHSNPEIVTENNAENSTVIDPDTYYALPIADTHTETDKKEAQIMKIVPALISTDNEQGEIKTDAMDVVIGKASVTIRYGVFGLGQAGGKIADAFASCLMPGNPANYYPALAVNTSTADLDALTKIPPEFRIELPNSHLGAMRQPELGYRAIMQPNAMERILKLCDQLFCKADQIIVAAGIGGGTGTGTIQVVCEALVEKGYNVIPMITIPRDLDSLEERKNAVEFLNMFQEMVGTGMVSAPIIVDNNLLYNHYRKNAPWDTDWKKDSNQQIVKAINEMNAASGIASQTTLDGAELLKLQRSGGCSTIGKAIIKANLDNEEFLETLQEELTDSLHNGLLCNYPQLNEARAVGIQVLIPENMVFGVAMEEAIYATINEAMPTLISKFVGYVPVEGLDEVIIYTLVSGLGLPERANELMNTVNKEVEYLTQADAKRTQFQANDVNIRNPYSKKGKKAVANPFARVDSK